MIPCVRTAHMLIIGWRLRWLGVSGALRSETALVTICMTFYVLIYKKYVYCEAILFE